MRVIVLFNLRPGADPAAYEAWARGTDLPTVRGLPSVAGFAVSAVTGLLGSDAPPPYAYVEVIDVRDPDGFMGDIGTEAMAQVAAAFQGWAEAPVFMVCRDVDAGPA